MKTPSQLLHEVRYTEFDIKRDRVVDFEHDDEWHDLLYKSNPDPEKIKQLDRWFKDNPTTLVRLYHGTNADFDIEHQGLLPTSTKRRNSYQSGSGFVYLSVFENMAKTFAQMAFPTRPIRVYTVEIPVYMLLPDKDQLSNKRQYADVITGDSLAESITHGHGVRVKGKIPPYFIKWSS